MKVTLVPCGSAVNESERKAFVELTRLCGAPHRGVNSSEGITRIPGQ